MPDLEGIQKEFNKKTYILKRLIHDRMTAVIDSCSLDATSASKLKNELESLLMIKGATIEKAPMQEIMSIEEFNKSEEALLRAVRKRYKQDPEFLTRLGKVLD